eukprot:s366_g29.t1
MLWGPGHTTSLPGVHFLGAEMENLRSVSQAGSLVSSSQSRKRSSADEPEPVTPNAPTKAAPRWSPSFFPTASTQHDPVVEPLIANAPQPVAPPPTEPAPATILLGVRRDAETPLDASEPDEAKPSTAMPSSAHASAEPATASDASDAKPGRRHVLNLENSLMPQPGLIPMHAMTQVPNVHPHAMPQVPAVVPKAMWPPHVSHQFAQPGSAAQPSSGATGFPPFDPSSGSYPWWEVSEKPDDEIRNTESSYHLRTRRRDSAVGLLVDPGAHDNLIGYSRWGHLNKKINYKVWLESRQLSVPLARLSGDVAAEQVSAGRDAFVEQPHGSGLYEEPEWLKLKPKLFTAVFDQCMTGLRMNKHP